MRGGRGGAGRGGGGRGRGSRDGSAGPSPQVRRKKHCTAENLNTCYT